MKKVAAVFFLILALMPSTWSQSRKWKVKHKSWSPAHEKKFSEFIAIMGETRCSSLQRCLTNKASNPFYYNKTPKNVRYPSDCADLPFTLRAFFAWMEGLPFDYVDSVSAAPENKKGKDVRYTKFGNIPRTKRSLVYGKTYDGPKEIQRIVNYISTAMYRTHFKYNSDFYPVKLSQKTIIPGTVLYDASGHAAIVYKIEKDGRVRLMDAHPDQSISYITFSKKFARSRPHHGAGFRNWRPEGSKKKTNHLPNFSKEMYNKRFDLNGSSLNYYDYIRAVLSGGNIRFDPKVEMKNIMLELCENTQDRVRAVQSSVARKIDKKAHPAKLPGNIYGTHGEWENYSTPSRDARLKTGFVEMKNEIQRFVKMYKNNDNRVVYSPQASSYSNRCSNQNATCFLAASLMETYKKVSNNPLCSFSYQKSNGRRKSLSYQDIVNRLFDLSFDPYNCIELRWGARGSELSSCRDNTNKRRWYQAQAGLRNQIERKYDQFMGYGINDTAKKLGVKNAPNVDLWSYLESHLDY